MTMAAFALWGLRIGLGVAILGAVYTVAHALNLVYGKKKPAVAPPPASAALELSKTVGDLLKPAYRFEDFLEDLKNPAISIDGIILKCGGKIPPEWEQRISPAPEKATPGPLAAVPVDEDRAKARKDWFNKLADSTPVIPVVPAPIPPPPVPTIKGWVIHCKWCTDVGTGQSGRRVDMNPGYRYGQYGTPVVHGEKRYINTCQYCGGKGLVMITGG